jgi:hypothetical protein
LFINYTPTEDPVGLPRLGSEDSTGVDFPDDVGEAPDESSTTRPLTEPTRLWEGVDVAESVVGGAGRFHGNFCRSHPIEVRAAACRSRSSRLRSKAVRYRSYASRKPRSTRDEKISSPRGFVVGGIDGIGTVEDDRFPNRVGEGDLAWLGGADLPENEGRGKR